MSWKALYGVVNVVVGVWLAVVGLTSPELSLPQMWGAGVLLADGFSSLYQELIGEV